MSRLAIIIPFAGNAKQFEDTLVSVLENRPEDCEIAVVLAHPYDDPYALADEVRFVCPPSGSGIAASLNFAVGQIRAPIVHVLSCGCEVSDGWADPAIEQFEDRDVAVVAPLLVDLEDRDRVVAAGIEYRRSGEVRPLDRGRQKILVDQVAGVPSPHPAAAFYRRSSFEMVGGFSEDVGDNLACLDLAMTLRRLGQRVMLDPRSQVAAPAAGLLAGGTFRRTLDAERFFWRWARCGGLAGALVPHLLHAAGDCFRGFADLSLFARLTGRVVGLCRGGASRRHLERLKKLEEASRPASVPAPKVQQARSSQPAKPAPIMPNGRSKTRVVRKAR